MNNSLTLKLTGYDSRRGDKISLGINSFEATFQIDPKEYLSSTLDALYTDCLEFNVEDAKKSFNFHHLNSDDGQDYVVTEDDCNIRVVSCCFGGSYPYDPEDDYIVYYINKEKLYSYLRGQLLNKNYSFHMSKFYITFDINITDPQLFPINGQRCKWNGEEYVVN